MSLELKIIDLGKMSYPDAWEIQRDLFEKRKKNEVPNTLLLVEHPPTISFGLNSEWNKLKVSEEEVSRRGINIYKSNRGGGVAYLGPGQLVGYTIMDISPFGGVLPFMRKLEEVMIRTAGDFGIKVERHDTSNPTTDKPYRATWYLDGEKKYVLCTKGIGCALAGSGLYTHHGFSLNFGKNDSYLDLIDPCGFPISEVRPISISEILGREINVRDVKKSVSDNINYVFAQQEVAV